LDATVAFSSLSTEPLPAFAALRAGINSNRNAAMTHQRDTRLPKKSLPAPVRPATLPNKVAVERQLARDI
jgi:hypothetical protein